MKDLIRKPILFLDLDGTVRKGYDELEPKRFVNKADDVEIFPGVVSMIRSYKRLGFGIVGITNQGGIATGQCKYDDACAAVVRTQELCDGLFDKIVMCQHYPGVSDPEMANCFCRKPKIGMLLMGQHVIAEMYDCICPPHLMLMVGDRPEDQKCTENAGIRFMWAKDWREQTSVSLPVDQLPYQKPYISPAQATS